jgi:hypothetical protein
MKNITLKLATFATLAAFTAPALAQTTLEDADGNGAFSFAELAVSYPNLTEDIFIGMDTDESGDISSAELSAGVTAGLLDL